MSIYYRIGTVVDNLVSVFSPKKARERIGYRNSFEGAKFSRTRDWPSISGSADEMILGDLPTLRARSRYLNNNDPHASGITGTMTTNIIGSGIKPQSRVDRTLLDIDDATADEFQKRAEFVFKRWIPHADAGERLDFYEMQNLIDTQILESGEAFVLVRSIADPIRPYSVALELIEADRIETPPEYRQDKSVRSGIRIGKNGEPVEYYVRKTHPEDWQYRQSEDAQKYVSIPAKDRFGRKNIFHLYFMKRPGQTRGIPFFAPVLNYFQDLKEYIEAERVAAKIAACFVTYVKTENPEQLDFGVKSSVDEMGRRLEKIDPGLILKLTDADEIGSINSNRPNNQYEMFVSAILRSISSALGLSYELVSKDFSKVNYSSARAALLEARRYFRMRQHWMTRKFCQPVWERVQEEAYLRGELKAESFYEYKYSWLNAQWIPPGWEWIDPLKQAKALETELNTGTSTLAEIYSDKGLDWEEQLEQLAREKKKRDELGLQYPQQAGNSLIEKEDTSDAKDED